MSVTPVTRKAARDTTDFFSGMVKQKAIIPIESDRMTDPICNSWTLKSFSFDDGFCPNWEDRCLLIDFFETESVAQVLVTPLDTLGFALFKREISLM